MRCLSTTWLLNIIRLVNENIPYYGDVFIMCPLKGLVVMNEDNILPKDMNDTDVSRPQQGLPIINQNKYNIYVMEHINVSVPNRGYLL